MLHNIEMVNMQNMDFYSGKNLNYIPNHTASNESEFYNRTDKIQQKMLRRSQSKANRLLAFIIGLCIVSFTVGLVSGIKFAGGEESTIVDDDTRNAVSEIGSRLSGMMKNQSSETTENNISNSSVQADINSNTSNSEQNMSAATHNPVAANTVQPKSDVNNTFPKENFPFVLQIDGKFTKRQSADISAYLAKKGNRVLISEHNDLFNIYVGPYETQEIAKNNLKKLTGYSDNQWYQNDNVLIIKR